MCVYTILLYLYFASQVNAENTLKVNSKLTDCSNLEVEKDGNLFSVTVHVTCTGKPTRGLFCSKFGARRDVYKLVTLLQWRVVTVLGCC